MKFWIGIDDTDSRNGMCTTYLAVRLIELLEKEGMKIIGFPRLVRLNPTIPYKTRGNGAVSFLVEGDLYKAMDITEKVIKKFSMLEDENTNPGVVFVKADDYDLIKYLEKFSWKAIRNVVTTDEAFFIVGKFMIPHLKYKNGRGIIGALASVGAELKDYTLELLAYRRPEKFGTKRVYEEKSFYEADLKTYPETWDTVDWHNKVVVAVPSSPDPVLYGIRGDKLEAILNAAKIVKTEEVDRRSIFITNHGTDMHLIHWKNIDKIENYHSYILRGEVCEKPYDIRGGHVFFTLKTVFGKIKCAAFEPTKQFRDIVRMLREGDVVEVYGSVKKETLNLEKMEVLKLAEVYELVNPVCPVCGKKMESAGRGQGYRCKKCKTKALDKVLKKIDRRLETGFYEVPPCARRHLSKPLVRFLNKENLHIFK